MTFKTWINDLRNVQSVINNISNTRVIINGATGLLNTNSLKEMSSAVSGLSKEQALLVLSTKNLNAAQQEQVLLAAGIISSENSITASAISQALAKTQLSATEKEALLTKLGLIDATTGEAIANATCTKEELLKVLATKGIVGADADAIVSSIGLTSANSAQAISFDLLTASIWANIKALGKWLITNPVGWAILGGTAIFGLVKAYDALTDSVEEVQERTDKLLDSYNSAISEANSNAKTIESLADRYGELSKGVNNLGENVSLTSDEYSEYKGIVDQIADMFPTLITGYTDEGTAILSLKGNVEKLRDAYKEAQTEAYNLLIVSGEDSDGNDIISNYKNQVNGNESWWSKQSSFIDGEGGARDAIDIITKLTGALTPDEFRDTYNELYEQYKNIWNSDKIQDALKSSGFEELSHAPKWGELTSDDLAKVKSTAQATIQTYKAEIDSQLKNVDTLANAYLMTNKDYSKLDEQSKTAASLIVNNITEDIANGFQFKEDVGAYVANIVSQLKDNPELSNAMIGLFTTDLSSLSVDDAKTVVDQYINTIAEILNEDPVELKIRLGFSDYDNVEPLKRKVQGFLKDEYDGKVGELSLEDLDIASKLEIPEGTLLSWDELKQKIEETKNAVSNETPIFKDIFELNNSDKELTELGKINEEIDKFQSAYTTLKETMDSYNETGTFTLDQVQGIISLGDEYLKYLMDENGELQLNEEALNNVAVARINEMRAKALSNLMDNLENIKNEEDALEYLKTQNIETAASYDELTKSKIRAWSVEAATNGMSEGTIKKVTKAVENQVSAINEMFDKIAISSVYTKSSSAAKKSISETFNWVQTLISRVQRSISNLGNAVSATYKKWTVRNGSLKAELSSVRKEISLQQAAYEAYLKKADSIKLSDHYKNLIQNGGLVIEDIPNETLKEQVETYKEWYEKALDCADAVSELNDKLTDLAKTKFDNISAQYDSKIKDIDHTASVIQNKLKEVELLDNIAGESFYNALLANEQTRIRILNSEYNEKVAAFNEAVRNGIETGSEMWQNMKSDIDEVYESIQQANNQVVEYKNSLKEIAKLKFDSINEQFDNAIGLLDSEIGKIDKEVQLIEQAGYTADRSFYNKLVESEKNNVRSLIEQHEDLSSAFNEGLDSGSIHKFDDNWYNMISDITDVENALLDSQAALIEYGNALRELDWSAFDKMQQSISKITSESDFFIGLLSGKDLYNENGTYTDEGLATRGLHAVNYDTYLRQAREYRDVISDIGKEIANDPGNNTLIERYEELCNLQREAIQNAQDEKDAILDLASNGYDKLLSYFDDLISARKNALKSASDLHDYENTISKQTASIEQYRKQLAAYSGDDSEDMRAIVQKAQQNLAEAEKELAETEYDKYVSDQEMLLDTFSNELQEWVNTRLDDVNGLFRAAIEQTNLNADKISNVISSTSVEFGVSLESLSSILQSTDYSGGIKDIVSGFYGDGGEFSTKMTTVENCINEIKDNKIPCIDDINSVMGSNFSDLKNSIPNLETTNNKLSDIETAINIVREAIESINNTVTEYEPVNQDYGDDSSGDSYDSHDEYTVSNVEVNNYNGANTQKEVQKTTKKTSAGGFGGKKSLNKTMLIEGGYAKGTTNAKKGYHTVAENGEEIIFGENGAILVDGQQLYPFRGGETVLNNDEVSNLYKLSKLPAESIQSLLNLNSNSMMASLSKRISVPSLQNNPGNSEINVEINNSFPGIKNYDEFLSKIQSDRKAERIIQNIVTDKMLGKNGYNKLKF